MRVVGIRSRGKMRMGGAYDDPAAFIEQTTVTVWPHSPDVILPTPGQDLAMYVHSCNASLTDVPCVLLLVSGS